MVARIGLGSELNVRKRVAHENPYAHKGIRPIGDRGGPRAALPQDELDLMCISDLAVTCPRRRKMFGSTLHFQGLRTPYVYVNKTYAAAWDELATLAQEHDGTLTRDGHRFAYVWEQNGTEVSVWATENVPALNLRVGEVSARFWNMDALVTVLEALT